MRPGITDLICLALVLIVSIAGMILEPPYRFFWGVFPLFVEVPLLCTALLLLSGRGIGIAKGIHIVLFVASGLSTAFSFFLILTILFAGLGIIALPVSSLLAANSLVTLRQIGARKRESAIGLVPTAD